MKWFWSSNKEITDMVDHEETLKAAQTTAKAAVAVEAQRQEGEKAKVVLQQKLENNHFRMKMETILFGKELK